MEVNWLTVLNTVLNVEVWIKGSWREEKRRIDMKLGSFVFGFLISHRSGLYNRMLPTSMFSSLLRFCFWSIKDLDLPSFILPSLSPSSLLFLFLPPPHLSCHIPSFVVCLVSSPQQWGWKLHFSWNVSCCKAPAGVIFFCKGKKKNIRLHLLHFMYVNQNSDAHLQRPARRCV